MIADTSYYDISVITTYHVAELLEPMIVVRMSSCVIVIWYVDLYHYY